MRFSLLVIIYKPNDKINANNYKMQKPYANFMRTENKQTEFRATTFQIVRHQLKYSNNQTVQVEYQRCKIERKQFDNFTDLQI